MANEATYRQALEDIRALDFKKDARGRDDFYSGAGLFVKAWLIADAALNPGRVALGQAWVSRVTMSNDPEVSVIGADVAPMPAADPLPLTSTGEPKTS